MAQPPSCACFFSFGAFEHTRECRVPGEHQFSRSAGLFRSLGARCLGRRLILRVRSGKKRGDRSDRFDDARRLTTHRERGPGRPTNPDGGYEVRNAADRAALHRRNRLFGWLIYGKGRPRS